MVRRHFDFLGQQAVLGKGLVQAVAGQGVVDQADVIGGHAFVDKRVEAVKTAKAGLAQFAAFGGVRIDKVKVLEVGRVLGRLAIQGQGVLPSSQAQAAEAQQQGAAGAGQQRAQDRGHGLFSAGVSHQARRPRV